MIILYVIILLALYLQLSLMITTRKCIYFRINWSGVLKWNLHSLYLYFIVVILYLTVYLLWILLISASILLLVKSTLIVFQMIKIYLMFHPSLLWSQKVIQTPVLNVTPNYQNMVSTVSSYPYLLLIQGSESRNKISF